MCASDNMKIHVQDVLNVVQLLENILDILLNLWFECIFLTLSMLDFHCNLHQVFVCSNGIAMMSMGLADQGWIQDVYPSATILSKTSLNLLIVAALLGKSILSSCFSTSSSNFSLSKQ
jgi:hypothetical protein